MEIRKVTLEDLDFALKLFNDLATRKNSFNPKLIEKDEYYHWFRNICKNDIEIYIAWIGEHRIGKCQIQNTEYGKMLSWAIHPQYRKQGYGKAMMKQMMEDREGYFYAYIKKGNIGSQKIAEAIGMEFIHNEGDFRYFKKGEQDECRTNRT